ncbi:MAG: hypothetical protein ACLP9Y_13270 [Mycobacterium sp.]
MSAPPEGGGDPMPEAAGHTITVISRTADTIKCNGAPPHCAPTQLRRRREASQRLPALDSGRADPWFAAPPGADGYADAVIHLRSVGLIAAPNAPGLHAMWKAGGSSRDAAQLVAEAWGLVAG